MTDQAEPSPAEWLEADGLGGFASGTAGGPRTRRYHALLLTAIRPPTHRIVLVNGMEAWVEREGFPAIPLTTQRYQQDILYPEGWRHVITFTAIPWPTWTYQLDDDATLSFQLFVVPDAAETILRWHASPGGSWKLQVRPLMSGRDQHALHSRNPVFNFDAAVAAGNVAWRPYPDLPAIAALTNGRYTHAPEWYCNFLYSHERDRGMPDREDLASPGQFTFDLAGAPATMILRAGDGVAVQPRPYAEALAHSERARRAASPGLEGVIAASYLADRNQGRTILAGFPWFTDWGRDSFIALRGLALAAPRYGDAQSILLEWSGTVSEGMLPNRFPDDGGAPEFNSVDASLWFIIAAHDFIKAAGPTKDVHDTLTQAVLTILSGYQRGTRFHIKMDTDALIAAGESGIQLTWMDAKVGDWVVTPRIGKPVEVQALWINALKIAADLSPVDAQRYTALAAQAESSFRTRFINTAGGLYDVIDADHIPGATDASLRPNQIFAIGGLPYPVLTGPIARQIVDLVEAKLLTPIGLRTLAPDDPNYRPHYRGTLLERDAAYHQGTVWPWLLGPFIEAWLRVRDNTPAARTQAAARFLPALEAHLNVDALGHVCEVADGDAPHTPGGCPFQAWSVGELIRIRRMLSTC